MTQMCEAYTYIQGAAVSPQGGGYIREKNGKNPVIPSGFARYFTAQTGANRANRAGSNYRARLTRPCFI